MDDQVPLYGIEWECGVLMPRAIEWTDTKFLTDLMSFK